MTAALSCCEEKREAPRLSARRDVRGSCVSSSSESVSVATVSLDESESLSPLDGESPWVSSRKSRGTPAGPPRSLKLLNATSIAVCARCRAPRCRAA